MGDRGKRFAGFENRPQKFREVLDCARPLALSIGLTDPTAAEDSRTPRRYRAIRGRRQKAHLDLGGGEEEVGLGYGTLRDTNTACRIIGICSSN